MYNIIGCKCCGNIIIIMYVMLRIHYIIYSSMVALAYIIHEWVKHMQSTLVHYDISGANYTIRFKVQ